MGVRDTIAKAIMGIKAYHSSPHDFDKFDLSKIGTGEGAQVYGHGLYFAENPAVSGQGGQYWQQFLSKFSGPERDVAERLKAANFDRKAAAGDLGEEMAWLEYNAKHASTPEAAAKHTQMLEALQRLESGKPVGPRTYEVNIKADPVQFLDWDKPLKEQPVFASAAGSRNGLLRDVLSRTDTGENLYKALSYDTGLWKKGSEATKILAGEGIPGIKYLDEGSRSHAANVADAQRMLEQYKGNPYGVEGLQNKLEKLQQQPITSNYVVFDPSTVDILKKYGVVGAPAGALGMGALADQSQYEVQP